MTCILHFETGRKTLVWSNIEIHARHTREFDHNVEWRKSGTESQRT
jgi:hypothetical protein